MGPMEMIEGPFEINGALMDMDVINEVVPLGSTEIWEFVNNTMVGHPIHIHDIQFNILERSGGPIQPWETGWKDVVFVPAMGSARVIMQFLDHADPDMPYMYHCHLLMHEDEGMMGQFVVVDPNGFEEVAETGDLHAWPTLASEVLNVRWGENMDIKQLTITDAIGRVVRQQVNPAAGSITSIGTSSLAPGGYLLTGIMKDGRRASSSFIIQH